MIIIVHVAALAYLHNMHGWADPPKYFLIRKMQEGSRRDKCCVDTRKPITWELMRQLWPNLAYVCFSRYEAIMFKAAYLLAFFGFLRIGEFTVRGKGMIQVRR